MFGGRSSLIGVGEDLGMPEQNAGIYELIVNMEIESQAVKNVFWYRAVDESDGFGLDLATAFWTLVDDDWTDWTSTSLAFQTIRVVNWGTSNVDAVLDISDAGDQAGDYAAVFVAARCDLNRSSKDTGPGYKRFAGVPVVDVSNGVMGGGTAESFSTFCALLDNLLDGPGDTDFQPCIINRKSLDDVPFSAVYSDVASVFARARLTSQNSRKVGVGV